MRRMIERRLLQHFGLTSMPEFYSETTNEFKEDVKFAILHDQMIALSGEVGAGKSMLFRNAVDDIKMQVSFVYVRNFYKERMTISNILNAILYSLTDENPRRDLEARSTQAVRVLGSHYESTGKQICVVIEEAHRLHANTLRALKELREAEFAGRSPLFSVALIGHPELLVKLTSRKEAYWRSHTIELTEKKGWMRVEERVRYLQRVFSKAITKQAAQRVAAICKTPLQMDFYVEEKMQEAKKLGRRVIDDTIVVPSLKEMKDAYGLSFGAIAEIAGIGKSTVVDVMNTDGHKQSDAVRRAIEKLSAKKAS